MAVTALIPARIRYAGAGRGAAGNSGGGSGRGEDIVREFVIGYGGWRGPAAYRGKNGMVEHDCFGVREHSRRRPAKRGGRKSVEYYAKGVGGGRERKEMRGFLMVETTGMSEGGE